MLAATSTPQEVSDVTIGTSSLSVTDTVGLRLPYTSEHPTQGSQEQQQEYDESVPIPNDPYDKWDEESIERAMTGDKRQQPKDFR